MILKYINKKFLLLLVGFTTFCELPAQDGVLLDQIVAKVDNYIVLKSELERAYLEYQSRGQTSGADEKCEILESLVVNKLLVAKAEIDSVTVTEIEVEASLENRIQTLVNQAGGSEKELEAYFEKSMEAIKNDIRDDMREQMIAQRMQATITEDIKVSPAEVKKFFNKIPKDSLPYYSTEVTLGQIVKIPDVSKTQKDKVKKQLIDIRNDILDGKATFSDMAKKYSQDPGSAARGGEYSWIQRGMFAPEYEAVAFKMSVDEISKPIETDFGIHIVQLLERRGNEYRSKHILIKPINLESDFDVSKNFLDSISQLVKDEKITFEKGAKDHSDDQRTASSGGFFLDQNEVPRISVDQLEPSVFFTLDTMKVGDISKAMRFRMDDGTEALRILYYKDKTPPHQANLKADYQKIYAATLNRKKGNSLNKWFESAKGDVFIDIIDEYNKCKILE